MSNSVQPHRRQPTRFLHPWDSPGKNTGVGCHFLLQCMHAKLLQPCPTLCDPMDSSLPGSSVHGILQARILERVARLLDPCYLFSQVRSQYFISAIISSGNLMLRGHCCKILSGSSWPHRKVSNKLLQKVFQNSGSTIFLLENVCPVLSQTLTFSLHYYPEKVFVTEPNNKPYYKTLNYRCINL